MGIVVDVIDPCPWGLFGGVDSKGKRAAVSGFERTLAEGALEVMILKGLREMQY